MSNIMTEVVGIAADGLHDQICNSRLAKVKGTRAGLILQAVQGHKRRAGRQATAWECRVRPTLMSCTPCILPRIFSYFPLYF